ncbi:MAG: hypothetical protein E6R03_01895 [Hyphomicrobiaceae bacterium]|nr:MAG: hypothetical protein E6R03_01895 [Hyphomicrobiaceae bacterium]
MADSCVYDNPYNLTRECWRDGVLMWMYSKALMIQFPLEHQTVPTWEGGRIVGDAAHLPDHIKDRIRNDQA